MGTGWNMTVDKTLLTAEKLKKSLRDSLTWFEHSGVMRPSDGSWGVAERIVLRRENPGLQRTMNAFPPWTEKKDYVIFEQRRADCCMQTAFLYLLASEIWNEPVYLQTTYNLLDFLFRRSGLLLITSVAPPELPPGVWNWSHSLRYHQYYFDDNAWCCALMLMIAEHSPALDSEFLLKKWALRLADAIAEAFPSYLSGKQSENTIQGDMKWRGNVLKPHWGSLVVMALSRAWEHHPDDRYRAIAETYHDYLCGNPGRFNSSEWGYAVIGAAFARRAFCDEKSIRVMSLFGKMLASAVDAYGNLPSEHAEAPVGAHLADLIYTLNWAVLALGSLTAWEKNLFSDPFDRVLALLLRLQDHSPEPYLFGCWHGMFDLKRQDWGGGNRSEGGAASIYTGWTNAPLAWAVAGRILGKSIENFTHAGNVRHEAEERVLK